jgi:alkylhydroperoxidase/carboxymuconolactone decarboxylase family protein YurZ
MDERGRELLQSIREHRGYVLPMHEFWASHDPEILEGYDRIFRHAMSKDSPLEPKVRELIVMVLDMALGVDPEVVRGHARKAIEQYGASEAEVVAALELATVVYAGRPLSFGPTVLPPQHD